MPYFQKVNKHYQNIRLLKAEPLNINDKAPFATALCGKMTEELDSRQCQRSGTEVTFSNVH